MIAARPPLDSAYLGGTPAMLPVLPRIAPRTRKPLRTVGQPVWTDRAVAAVVELFWQEQRGEQRVAQAATE